MRFLLPCIRTVGLRRNLTFVRSGMAGEQSDFFCCTVPAGCFFLPGLLLVLLGGVGYALALPGIEVAGAVLDVHTLLFSSVAVMCGYQSVLFSVLAKTFAVNEGMMPKDRFYDGFYRMVNLERGIALAVLCLLGGVGLMGWGVYQWQATGFGALDYPVTMRGVIPGATLCVLGFQTLLSSFFVSILGMRKRIVDAPGG